MMRSTTKSKFCHVALMRCLVKFVVLQSHSQSTCVLNQCHIRINTHLVSHIETFCFSLYFSPTKFVSLLLLFSFNCLATIHLEAFVERKEKANHIRDISFSKNLQFPINKQKKQLLYLEISQFSHEGPKSLLRYDLALPKMVLSSFHCHFKVRFSKATLRGKKKNCVDSVMQTDFVKRVTGQTNNASFEKPCLW